MFFPGSFSYRMKYKDSVLVFEPSLLGVSPSSSIRICTGDGLLLDKQSREADEMLGFAGCKLVFAKSLYFCGC